MARQGEAGYEVRSTRIFHGKARLQSTHTKQTQFGVKALQDFAKIFSMDSRKWEILTALDLAKSPG
jgi:hypothetical protein